MAGPLRRLRNAGARTQGTHRICLAETGSAPEALNLHDGTCNQGRFHPDSDVLLTGSWDGSLALSGMGEAARLSRHIPVAGELRILHAGQHPFITSADGSTVALMTPEGIAVRRGDDNFKVVPGTRNEYNRALHLSQDGGLLSVRGDGCRLWNTTTGKQLSTLRLGGSPCFAGAPPLLIGGQSEASFIEARDPASGDLRWRTPLPGVTAEICAASLDGTLVVVAASDGSLLLVETATGRIPAILTHPDARLIRHVCFSPDGTKIAAATAAGTVLLWNLPLLRQELAALGLDW